MAGGGHDNHGGGGGDAHEHKKHKKHGGHGHGGGHEEHEEGVPEWVVSFADNALLQMGFFVILLALNMKPASSGSGGAPVEARDDNAASQPAPPSSMLDGAIAIREAFNNPVNMASGDPNDLPLIRRIIQRKEGESQIDGPPGDKQDVQSVRPSDYHRVGGVISFEEGSSRMDGEGVRTAAAVASEIKGRKSIIEIRGHASLAEAQDPTDRGIALSFERALAVTRVLRDSGLQWEQMRVVSCGIGDRIEPIARSASSHGRNQRVEVIVTDEQMPADPYTKDPSAAP